MQHVKVLTLNGKRLLLQSLIITLKIEILLYVFITTDYIVHDPKSFMLKQINSY